MIKILKLALPWILIIGFLLALLCGWIPSYYSHLFICLCLFYVFLQVLWETHKNPSKKLRWFEYFELFLCPLVALLSFYTFWLQIPH